jgi:hypothetical protein
MFRIWKCGVFVTISFWNLEIVFGRVGMEVSAGIWLLN